MHTIKSNECFTVLRVCYLIVFKEIKLCLADFSSKCKVKEMKSYFPALRNV